MSKQLAFLVFFVILLIGGLFWVRSYSDKNLAYYKTMCPYGSIVIVGKGYCLDKDGFPYFLEDFPGRAGPADVKTFDASKNFKR